MVDEFELGTDGPTSILVGLDASETSIRAAAYAAGLARRQGAQLLILFVHTTSAAEGMAVTAGAARQAQDAITQEVHDLVETGRQYLQGVRSEFIERSGNPYKEIIALAHERRVDAIVVGASTQAGHRLVGSLAGRLVRDAAWPVTVVP